MSVRRDCPLPGPPDRGLVRRLACLAVGGALLAACSGAGLRTDYQIAHERAAAYVAAHPELDRETAAAIARLELRKGMSREEVIAAWGYPAVAQRFRRGTVDYWYFGCYFPHLCTDPDEESTLLFPSPDQIFQSRALFENGKLVSWRS